MKNRKIKLFELKTFIEVSNAYLAEFPVVTKLEYALKKLTKKALKHFETFNEEIKEFEERIQDVKSLNCATDKDGIQLLDEKGNYRFTTAGEIKARKEIRELNKEWKTKSETLLETEVDFEPFYVATEHLPSNLSDTYREVFEGFVIEPTKQ